MYACVCVYLHVYHHLQPPTGRGCMLEMGAPPFGGRGAAATGPDTYIYIYIYIYMSLYIGGEMGRNNKRNTHT